MANFNTLPLEMKWAILELAVPLGRILSICPPRGTSDIPESAKVLVNRLPPPALSQVNRESRYWTLQYYGINYQDAGVPFTVGVVNFKWYHPVHDYLAFYTYTTSVSRFNYLNCSGSADLDWLKWCLAHKSHARNMAAARSPFFDKTVRSMAVWQTDKIVVPYLQGQVTSASSLLLVLNSRLPRINKVIFAKIGKHSLFDQILERVKKNRKVAKRVKESKKSAFPFGPGATLSTARNKKVTFIYHHWISSNLATLLAIIHTANGVWDYECFTAITSLEFMTCQGGLVDGSDPQAIKQVMWRV